MLHTPSPQKKQQQKKPKKPKQTKTKNEETLLYPKDVIYYYNKKLSVDKREEYLLTVSGASIQTLGVIVISWE